MRIVPRSMRSPRSKPVIAAIAARRCPGGAVSTACANRFTTRARSRAAEASGNQIPSTPTSFQASAQSPIAVAKMAKATGVAHAVHRSRGAARPPVGFGRVDPSRVGAAGDSRKPAPTLDDDDGETIETCFPACFPAAAG